MITREDLLKSSEYWIEIIQNKVYNVLAEYIESHDISNNQIAKSLGISKGRVSQILSGDNLNFRLDTLVKLCLTIDKIPDFHLMNIEEYLLNDSKEADSIIFKNLASLYKPLEEGQIYKSSGGPEVMRLKPSDIFSIVKEPETPDKPTVLTTAA
jgi:predicted XRE-type DNA-binding protein